MANRPSLTAVMDKGAQRVEETVPAPSGAAERKPGKKRLGWTQLNVYVPEALRTKAKVKALQENRDMSEIVTELLTAWTEQG